MRQDLLGALYLSALLVLGGGGSPAPLAELLCELIAGIVLVVWLASSGATGLKQQRSLYWVVGLIAALPMLQLLPLPPTLWRALPGREQVTATLDLVGAGADWHAFSISPPQTLAALLSLGPPLLILAMTAALASRKAEWLVRTIAILALASVLVGAGQLASGNGGPFDFYATGDVGVLHGFQANRNTEALVLLVGMVALALEAQEFRKSRGRAVDVVFAALALVLLFGVILTASRTGISLLPVALGFGAAILRSGGASPRFPVRRIALGTALIGLAATGAVVLSRSNAVLGKVAGRFDFTGEFRPELWRDTLYAIGQYWPLGSGLGTFIPAFLPAERLEVVDATLPHRAHNELLELALEGGVPLLVCWAGVTGIVLWQLRQAWRARPDAHPQLLFAAAIFALTALHSLVDYPFRSMAMASLVAVGAGLAIGLAEAGRRTPRIRTDDGQ